MSRWKAASIHLLMSIIVVGIVASYIVYFWYPPALIHMAKADRLLMLIAGIDLIVGPLLTLIIYKADKKYLKLDLFVIALIQFSFLAYGMYATWNSRPVFLVAVPDRFELVFANEIIGTRLAEAKVAKYQHLSFTKPVLVGAKMPEDAKEREDILFSAVGGRGDIQTMPKYFVEYPEVKNSVLKHARPLTEGKDLDKRNAEILQNAAKSYGFKHQDLRYLTLASSRGYATILIKSDNGEIVGPVNVDP